MDEQNEPLITLFGKVELATIEKKLKGTKLKQTEKNYLSRSIRPKLRAAQLAIGLNLLSRISNRKKENTILIENNLDFYGYPLIGIRKRPIKRFIEAIPILITKNPIDPFKLLEIAAKHGIKNQIGYLLETAFTIKPVPKLKPLLKYLEDSKEQRIQQLVEGDAEFLKKTSPSRIKRWNLLGRFFDEDFKALAEAYP
ncbi:hypothetical protein HYV84_00275 [Candidatus Woesearchaeota archaeon]|nr:hypothetical protein [Candidatus Woesearchaeota archaeon]